MEKEIFIGADTALSTYANEKNKRVSLPDTPVVAQKIYVIGDMVIYCGGRWECVPPTIKYISDNPKATNHEIVAWLNENITPFTSDKLGLTLFLCSLADGQSLVRGFDSLGGKFTCQEYGTPENIMVISGGYKVPEIREAATKLLIDSKITGDTMADIYTKAFESVACAEVGGSICLYTVSNQAALLNNYAINENGIEYFYINSLDQIRAYAITADRIQAGAISTRELAAGAIVADNLAANSILAHHIGAGQITAEKIAAGAISADMITAGTLNAGVIYTGAINASQITSGFISADRIQGGVISGVDINTQHIVAIGIVVGGIPVGSTLQTLQQQLSALTQRVSALEAMF